MNESCHAWMSHVARVTSCHIIALGSRPRVMSHMDESYHIWMSHFTNFGHEPPHSSMETGISVMADINFKIKATEEISYDFHFGDQQTTCDATLVLGAPFAAIATVSECALLCVTVWCRELQCGAMCCDATMVLGAISLPSLRWVNVCCSVLQGVAVRCSGLWRYHGSRRALHCHRYGEWMCAAVCCSEVQCVAISSWF